MMNDNADNYRDRLQALLLRDALQFGDFTLASGQKSKFYMNCKKVTLSSEGSFLVGQNLLNLIPENCQSIGGLTLGADPMVSSVTVVGFQMGRPMSGFLVRKEQKGHGTTSQIENAPPAGSHVTIVEDVITTGGSAWKATEIAQASGLHVDLVISLVDRSGGVETAFDKAGIPVKSLFTIEELLKAAESR